MKKKHITRLLFIYICCIFIGGCGDSKKNQKQASAFENVSSGGENVKFEKDFFMGIQYGNSFEALQEQIGEPSRYEGNIKKYPVYLLEEGGYACVLYCHDKIQEVWIYDDNNEIIYGFDSEKISSDMLKQAKHDVNIDDFEQIQWGFDYKDLLMTVGLQDSVVGSGSLNYLYDLEDGTNVTISVASWEEGIFCITAYDKGGNQLISKIRK